MLDLLQEMTDVDALDESEEGAAMLIDSLVRIIIEDYRFQFIGTLYASRHHCSVYVRKTELKFVISCLGFIPEYLLFAQ